MTYGHLWEPCNGVPHMYNVIYVNDFWLPNTLYGMQEPCNGVPHMYNLISTGQLCKKSTACPKHKQKLEKLQSEATEGLLKSLTVRIQV